MDSWSGDSFLILLGVLLVPAVSVFAIMTYLRLRRAKFHRQRITKGKKSFVQQQGQTELVMAGELGCYSDATFANTMAIEIKVLQRGDESVLLNVAAEVFDNPIDAERTREFLEDPRHHIAVVIDDGLVIGFASGVHYIHPDKPPELWINEVALAPTHRRRGLGKAVLRALFEVGRAHNCAVAWVLTDQGNPAAMALYSSVGGTEGADDTGTGNAMRGYSFALKDTGNGRPSV